MAVRSEKGPAKDRDADIFISYQRDTADKARRLADALRRDNRDVFIDLKLSSDSKWRADIEKRLGRARCVVAIWSKKASTSGWVNYEAFRAQQEGKLIAVSFDPIKAEELPGWLTDQQITSLRGWQDVEQLHDGWLSVSRAVHAKCGKLPDYKFKGWLANGPAHERVTSLSFHPTEDARLLSTGFEGAGALWLASTANPDWRGKPEFDRKRSSEELGRYGQVSRFDAPSPPKDYQRASVWRAQYSIDGERVVLSCRDGVARVFDCNMRNEIAQLRHNERCGAVDMGFANRGGGQHKDGVYDACFLPDGTITTIGGSRAVLWSQEGEPLHETPIAMPEGAPGVLVRALYCDAVEGVVLGDRLGKVRVLEPTSGEIGSQIDDRADTTVHFAFGPSLIDGKVVQGVMAIVSQSPLDAVIKFHTWAKLPTEALGAFSKARSNSLTIETAPIRAIALHPNAPVIAVASNAVQPKLFDYENNEALPLGRATDTFGWHDNATTAVAFSASGKYFAAGSEDGRISIWETRAGALSSTKASVATNMGRRAGDRV